MSALSSVNWGSVADWVSGIGSIGASLVALYLSGAEKRAQREADRPDISCRVTWDANPDAWHEVFLEMLNSSVKSWNATSIEVIGKGDVKIVRNADTLKHDDGGSIIPTEDRRHEIGSRKIGLNMKVQPVGSPSSWTGGRSNHNWDRFQVFLPSNINFMKLKVRLESDDPIPDVFHTTIVRQRHTSVVPNL